MVVGWRQDVVRRLPIHVRLHFVNLLDRVIVIVAMMVVTIR